jgi:riboflavin biosynthesis pyrimidine reductase
VRLTGNPVRIVLDQNSRLQKESHTWQSNQNYFLQNDNWIKKTLPLLSSTLKKHSNSNDRYCMTIRSNQ